MDKPIVLKHIHYPKKRRILIVDDLPATRGGIRYWLSRVKDLTVCAEAEDIPKAKEAIKEHKPDLAIVDLGLKDASGTELISYIKKNKPGLPIIVYTIHENINYVEKVLNMGVEGYILKYETPEQTREAIRKVLDGGTYVTEVIYDRYIKKAKSEAKNGKQTELVISKLTDSEFQFFKLLGQNLSPEEIARQRDIKVKTVYNKLQYIRRKFSLKNVNELKFYATEWLLANSEEIVPKVNLANRGKKKSI